MILLFFYIYLVFEIRVGSKEKLKRVSSARLRKRLDANILEKLEHRGIVLLDHLYS